MWWRAVLFPTVLLLGGAINAQQPSSTPSSAPRPGTRDSASIAEQNSRFERLRVLDVIVATERSPSHPLLDPKRGIYRRPAKEEYSALAVDAPLIAAYAGFLKASGTGIVKLNAEASCVSANDVIVGTEVCSPFKIPGAGAAYSFRTGSYRVPRLSDLILFNGAFLAGGVFQEVVITNLGDVPVEEVGLGTPGLKYLIDIEPVSDDEGFISFDEKIKKGINADGYAYRKVFPLNLDSTYVLRSIAYRGSYVRSIDGVQYDELDYDKRRDVIVTFRTIDRDPAGNITILWKTLKDVESPKLKAKK